jgi:hypothetical protein
VARDVYNQKDLGFTTAKYLWATWKVHTVKEKYLRHQFYEHPSISAVLACHLADNYVKPDDAQASKIKALEALLKTLQTKVDTLQMTMNNFPTIAPICKEEEHDTPSLSLPQFIPQVQEEFTHRTQHEDETVCFGIVRLNYQTLHDCIIIAEHWPGWLLTLSLYRLRCTACYISNPDASWVREMIQGVCRVKPITALVQNKEAITPSILFEGSMDIFQLISKEWLAHAKI